MTAFDCVLHPIMPEALLQQRLSVAFEYPIVFSRDVFAAENDALHAALRRSSANGSAKVCAFVDSGVADATPDLRARIEQYLRERDGLSLAGPPRSVPGGERCKNDETSLRSVLETLDVLGMDRHAFVVCVGGGAVLDMVGYAAAITHRGLRVVRVPTTVLAQADSAVGVKNGVNAFGKKNFLGTFSPPAAVLIDPALLDTLSDRDVVAGMAEAVKVALLADPELYAWIRCNTKALVTRDAEALDVLVRRSASLHAAHIARSGDCFERSTARPLDFGHWSAHKLETLTGHALRHGEAVAIGMALDLRYAAAIGATTTETSDDVIATLQALGLPTYHPALELRHTSGRRKVLDGVDEFREHIGGDLNVTLIHEPGRAFDVGIVDEDAMSAAIVSLRPRRAA